MANVVLKDKLDVRTVGGTLEQVRQACLGVEAIDVDASLVTGVDTAGAQLLVSFANSAGGRARWRLSPALERDLTGLGFSLDRFSRRDP